ncbi:preprotein translocase subunit SecE [Aestuariimicrobium ganziense]|uniref:preprotein translocase subunit SecE n=1 Tax=Aestuariimicrobium ganziense TaxID=2773677 RepID=UPI0019427784|nr:preprotein translocase subunit SecE [Aestuariimicrobium ganziense]
MTDDKLSPHDGEVDPSGEDLAAELSDPGDYEIAADETEAEELTDADDDVLDDTPDEADPEDVVVDDPEQLAAAETVAAKARSSRPVKRSAGSSTTAKKATATSKRSERTTTARVKRTTPAEFVGQSAGELRKVNWPTGDQLRQYFIVVLVFVVIIITFVGLLDLAFGWALLKLFGDDQGQ